VKIRRETAADAADRRLPVGAPETAPTGAFTDSQGPGPFMVEAALRFVVARRDLRVTRNEIKSTIRAGSLVRADSAAVREAPGEFFTPTTLVFHVELDEYGRDDGRFLRKLTSRTEFEQLPPPGPDAEDQWREWWQTALRKQGHAPWDMSVQRLDESTFLVRASVDRAVPAQPQIIVNVPEQPAPIVNVPEQPAPIVNVPEQPAPIVNVTIDSEPATAIVEFERDPSGLLVSATITEEPKADGQLEA
jgi:hypothetical protein